jgi:hypothetical protein
MTIGELMEDEDGAWKMHITLKGKRLYPIFGALGDDIKIAIYTFPEDEHIVDLPLNTPMNLVEELYL